MIALHEPKRILGAAACVAAILLAGCASMSSTKTVNVTLSGGEEVPPVTTKASGSGTVTVGEDKSLSGSITTAGLGGVAAHIHVGARGKNGPVAVGMTKSGDNGWMFPAGAKLTDEQYKAFLAGDTYLNVHTPANKGGEIRGQLTP